jgi:hypothetical protein
MRLRPLMLLVLAAPPGLLAQPDYPRHNFSIGAGAAQPRGDLRPLYSDRPALNFGYGYRFMKNLQFDAGFETVFGAANIRDYLNTDFGPLRIRDYQFLVPVGGRAILPLAGGRVLISGGGGAAYLRYQEILRQPGDTFDIECDVCAARDGWAWYALAEVGVYLDSAQHFRIGATTRVYRGHTDGDALGSVPPVRTRDHWVNTYGQFTFSF